jgi:stress response protein SCP2
MLNLRKDIAEPLTGVSVLQAGVAWKTSGGGRKGLLGRLKREVGTDLDLVAVAFSDGEPVRMCWFDNTDAFDNGSLVSLGDNRTGKGDGDDETIVARLNDVPAGIDSIVFIVCAYKEGVNFSNVEGITLNVYDGGPGGKQLGSYWPRIDSRHTACVMAKATRGESAWSIEIVNEMGHGQSREALLQLAGRYA